MATYTPTGTDARGPNLRSNAFRAPYTVWDFKNLKGRGEGVAATNGSHRAGAPLVTFSIVPGGLPLTGSRLFISTPSPHDFELVLGSPKMCSAVTRID